MGIIAACGPSLKPLVGNLLHLSSGEHRKPNYGGYYGRQTGGRGDGALTIGSARGRGYAKQHSRSGYAEDFELHRGGDRDKDFADVYPVTSNSAKTAVNHSHYPSHREDDQVGHRSGSEETILGRHTMGGKKGIIRTTEVTVTY